MVRIRSTKLGTKAQVTGLGCIVFEDGISTEEFEQSAAEELCAISPSLEVVYPEGKSDSELPKNKTAPSKASGRGRTKAAVEEQVEEQVEAAVEVAVALSEEDQELLKNLQESSLYSLLQILEEVGTAKEQYENLPFTTQEEKEVMIQFVFDEIKDVQKED